MNFIINFFKDILMLDKNNKSYVGLTWLNQEENSQPVVNNEKPKGKKEVKLSDLMRKAN